MDGWMNGALNASLLRAPLCGANKGLLSKAEILLPSILIRRNLFVCLVENWEEVAKFGGL